MLFNRLDTRGFRGGVQTTFMGVATAPNQFAAVTGTGPNDQLKFRGSADLSSLTTSDCDDLTGAVQAMKDLLENGPQYNYTFFLQASSTDHPGEIIAGNVFWRP